MALRLDLTPGLVRVYEVERAYRSHDGQETTVFLDRLTYTVGKDRDGSRAKVTLSYVPVKTVLDGQEFLSSSGAKPLELTEFRDELGRAFERQLMPLEPQIRERQNRIADVMLPQETIAVGTTWGRSVPAIEGGFPPARWTWNCVALSKQDATLRLDFQESEDRQPLTASGTIRLDLKSGWLESATIVVEKTVTPGDSEPVPVSLTVTWKRLA